MKNNRFQLLIWMLALSLSIFILSFFAIFMPKATTKVMFDFFHQVFEKYKDFNNKVSLFN